VSLLLLFGGGGGGPPRPITPARAKMGKEFIVFVELYIDECQLTYGVGPCTASIPATGTQECFNTLRTCQDLDNYDRGATLGHRKIYRFSTTDIPSLQESGDSPTFPTVRSVDTAPTKLSPGKGLGIRSSVVVQINDHPWTDIGVDPYHRDRAYLPDDRGSFWGKFLARNPNYEGRRFDILTGFLDDGVFDIANFTRRTYLLNKINGPDSDGVVTIEAKDPLKKADVDKSVWPPVSQAELTTSLGTGDVDVFFGDPDGFVAAMVSDGQVYARIDDEIIRITALTDDGAGFYHAVVSRTDSPSVYDNSLNIAAEHELGAIIQPCYFFDGVRIDGILLVLLRDAALIDASYLPTADWDDAVLGGGLDNYLFTTLIVEPTGVNTLLQELSQHGMYMWWDEREQVVSIQSIIPQEFSADAYTEDTNIIAGSISVRRDVSNRVSQAWMYYGLRFPTLDLDLSTSYSAWMVKVDADAESPEEYDQRRISKVYSRWLPINKQSTASEISTRLLRSYRDSKIVLSMALDPKDDDAWTGGTVGVITALVQDETGSPVQNNFIVLQVDESISDDGVIYKYILQAEATLRRTGVIAPTLVLGSPFPDYGAATDTQKDQYAFISPSSGVFSDGTPAYQIR
jgi:hypothetical protein